MDFRAHGEPCRPSGTVAFLFTDIEGSTRLWETQKPAMQRSLAVHDSILRKAIESPRRLCIQDGRRRLLRILPLGARRG
jgi:hypothetical protein